MSSNQLSSIKSMSHSLNKCPNASRVRTFRLFSHQFMGGGGGVQKLLFKQVSKFISIQNFNQWVVRTI